MFTRVIGSMLILVGAACARSFGEGAQVMFGKSSALILIAALAAAGCKESSTHAHGEPDQHASAPKAHDHGHGDPDKAAASPTLNDGKPWPTDATLRTGMTVIRDQLQAAVKPIHAGTYSPGDYKALAERIDKEVGTIMSNCKLPPDADNQLHLVLTQIVAGTEQMKKDGDRMAGAVKVIGGLQSYGKFFDHPDWKPLDH
jgi:hypothetical protein